MKRIAIVVMAGISILLFNRMDAATIYSNNFEIDNGGFVTNGANYKWEWGRPTVVGPSSAYSGTNCWGTDLDSYYLNSMNDKITLSNINLTGKTYASLSLYIYYYTEGYYDAGYLYVSTNAGTNFFKIGDFPDFYDNNSTWAGGPGWSGYGGSWMKKELDLTPFVNKIIDLQFVFRSDFSVSGYPGVYIDDLVIKDTPIPVAGTGSAYIDPMNFFTESTGIFVIRYQAEKNLVNGSKVSVDIPTGWTAPQKTNSAQLGFVQVTQYSGSPKFNPEPTITGNKITVYITNMAKYDQIEIRYGKGAGAKTPATAGNHTFVVKSAGPSESLTEISSSPVIKLFNCKPAPYAEDFEGTADGWYQEYGTYNQWEKGAPSVVGPPSAQSGTKCYGINIDGYYIDDWTAEYLYSLPIDLRSANNAYLSFWHWFDIFQAKSWMYDDGAAVYVSTNNMDWTKLGYYPVDYNNNGETSMWYDMAHGRMARQVPGRKLILIYHNIQKTEFF